MQGGLDGTIWRRPLSSERLPASSTGQLTPGHPSKQHLRPLTQTRAWTRGIEWKERRRMSDSCEPVGGWGLPQHLSLQSPRMWKAVFPQYLLCLRHWDRNQRNVPSVIGHLGAANSHMVGPGLGGLGLGVLFWASGKTFLCEQPTRSACDCGSFFLRKAGFVLLPLSCQAGGTVCGYRIGQEVTQRAPPIYHSGEKTVKDLLPGAHVEGKRLGTSNFNEVSFRGSSEYHGSPLQGMWPRLLGSRKDSWD